MAFSEIIVIVLIALLVLGPERLPKLARDLGHFVGRARAMARQFTDQLEHEVRLEEMARQKAQSILNPTKTSDSTPTASGSSSMHASPETVNSAQQNPSMNSTATATATVNTQAPVAPSPKVSEPSHSTPT
jgi:sec-independent protein translocase protein TatB